MALHPVLSWLYRHLRTVCAMSSAITKRIVLTSEPRDRPYELRDAQVRGLILRVQPSGHKAWIVTWAHGKRRTLGSVEHLTLDQARDQARQAVAEYVQSGLPALAKSKPKSCTWDLHHTVQSQWRFWI
ncbi:Arm DNA-binding domain-containing protein [Stenotrophomonas maltophilia]|uniref:Arm DNA-binding domain-containing protein n=1 Tax=Stenotrophomonas maltophilia TaxID=40324 RepID=UPI0009C1918E